MTLDWDWYHKQIHPSSFFSLSLLFFVSGSWWMLSGYKAFSLFLFWVLWNRVSCSPDWLQTYHVAEHSPEFLILPSLPPRCWDSRYVPHPVRMSNFIIWTTPELSTARSFVSSCFLYVFHRETVPSLWRFEIAYIYERNFLRQEK